MALLRMPRSFLVAGVFLLICFGLLTSTLRRTSDDSRNRDFANIGAELGTALAQTSQEAFTTLASSATVQPTSAAPTTSSTPQTQTPVASGSGADTSSAASPNDVALILKTGSNNVWRRLPLHILTTFANAKVPNYGIYSDATERLAHGVETIDAISNVTHLLQRLDPKAYGIYYDQKDAMRSYTYREQAGLTGDSIPSLSEDGNPDGWVLDRYKFLPMLAHAWRAWPDVKWYIYIEDDTYLFWDNILHWVAQHSHREAVYFGASSGPSNATFAQGGSGIVFSQATMEKLFASDHEADLSIYGNRTANACCGDIILGEILKDNGIMVNRGEFGSLSFQPEPPWKTRFDVSVWCEPIFTFHHLHQQDMAALAELEIDVKHDNRQKVLFMDVYMKFVDPYLKTEILRDWDNYADLIILKANGTLPSALRDTAISLETATTSSSGCQEACKNFTSCFSWRFEEHSCSLDTGVKLGRAILSSQNHNSTITSGWMLDRLNETLLSHECWGFRDWR